MEKTTVYLTSDQKAALGRAAEASGTSEARLIRDGIDVMTGGRRTGETLTPLASTTPPRFERPRWITRDAFLALLRTQADAALTADLRDLAPDTTDDEPLG